MLIEVLVFEGCPNRAPTVAMVTGVARDLGIAADVVEVEVADDDAAQRHRFIGSPSVRVDGIDIEPAARTLERFGLMCRVYRQGATAIGVPPRSLVEAALRGQT